MSIARVYKIGPSSGRIMSLPKGHKHAASYFETEALAKQDYERKILEHKRLHAKHKPAAMALLDSAEVEFLALQKRLGVEIDYFFEGDTHGIHDDAMTISTTIEGHYYSKRISK